MWKSNWSLSQLATTHKTKKGLQGNREYRAMHLEEKTCDFGDLIIKILKKNQ